MNRCCVRTSSGSRLRRVHAGVSGGAAPVPGPARRVLAWRMGDPIESVMQAASDFKVDGVLEPGSELAALERDRTVQQWLHNRAARSGRSRTMSCSKRRKCGLSGDPFQRHSAYSRPLVGKMAGRCPSSAGAFPRFRRPARHPLRLAGMAFSDGSRISEPADVDPAGEQAAHARLQWSPGGAGSSVCDRQKSSGERRYLQVVPICVSGRSPHARWCMRC